MELTGTSVRPFFGGASTMSTVEAAVTRAGDAAFMGHPRGLFYLAFIAVMIITIFQSTAYYQIFNTILFYSLRSVVTVPTSQ
jgi:hypothetical protein